MAAILEKEVRVVRNHTWVIHRDDDGSSFFLFLPFINLTMLNGSHRLLFFHTWPTSTVSNFTIVLRVIWRMKRFSGCEWCIFINYFFVCCVVLIGFKKSIQADIIRVSDIYSNSRLKNRNFLISIIDPTWKDGLVWVRFWEVLATNISFFPANCAPI